MCVCVRESKEREGDEESLSQRDTERGERESERERGPSLRERLALSFSERTGSLWQHRFATLGYVTVASPVISSMLCQTTVVIATSGCCLLRYLQAPPQERVA